MTEAQREWARCRPWIEAAIAKCDLYDISDIEEAVQSEDMHFWPGKECAAVTEFITFPNKKALNVFAGGGTRGKALRELLAMEKQIARWGVEHGCSLLLIFGANDGTRLAGERAGYRHLWTVMSKDI